VIAPSLIPRRSGERVKTDRLDALRLVRCYRAGELVAIVVPSKEQERLRDLLRAVIAPKATRSGACINWRSFCCVRAAVSRRASAC
jgi:transposase